MSDFFVGYQGEQNLTGWPHTILSGEPNSREPEALPHQQNKPHALHKEVPSTGTKSKGHDVRACQIQNSCQVGNFGFSQAWL
jgi:hypothetical protein